MCGPKRAVQRPELGGKGARKSQQTDEEFTRGAGLTSARLGCKRFSEADSYPGGQTNKAREPEAQGLRVGWGPEPPRLTARHRHQDGPGRPAPFPGPAGCDGKPPPPVSAAGPEEAASDTAHLRPPKTSSVKHLRQASPSPWKPPAFAVGSRDRRTGQGRACWTRLLPKWGSGRQGGRTLALLPAARGPPPWLCVWPSSPRPLNTEGPA